MSNGKKIMVSSILVYKFYSLLGRCCRLALTILSPRRLTADKEVAGTDLVLFCGRKGAAMLKAVLLSIYYNWQRIPRLTVVSDGTPKEVLEAALRFWPFPYEIKSWEDCAAWHRSKDRQVIIDFARVNPYARKMLSVLAEAESRPVFYCDTDVLWFAEPPLPDPAPGNGCVVRISRDNMHCYHPPAIRYLDRQDLMEKPAINCGVVYLSGSVYDNYPGFEELMQFIAPMTVPLNPLPSPI